MRDDLGALAHWDDRLDTVVAWCELDHGLGESPRPRLFGYLDDLLTLVIDLRPFPPGGIEAPFTEATAGLLGAGCTAVVAALPGRAWSLDDPIVPVLDDHDLRQRVVAVAAARRGEPTVTSIRPFECRATELRWLPEVDGEGVSWWVADALRIGVEHGIEATIDEAADQLARCCALGHVVMVAEGEAAR